MVAFTNNLGVEKPDPGARPNTWGGMVNTNMDLIDRALGGRKTITVTSSGTNVYGVDFPQDLDISTTGALSDGHYPAIEYTDDGDLNADLYVRLTPNNAERTITFRNSLTNDRNLVVFQGNYASASPYTVPNGYDATLVFDGLGASATVTRLVEKQSFEEIDVAGQLSAGSVDSATRAMLGSLFYPVGSIYITVDSTNPNTSLGFGTWVRFGVGKTLISDNSSEVTGGSPKITVANLPSHRHGVDISGNTGGAGAWSKSFYVNNNSTQKRGLEGPAAQDAGKTRVTLSQSNHNHSFRVSGNTEYTGAETPTDFLPPYITVYMWKREA